MPVTDQSFQRRALRQIPNGDLVVSGRATWVPPARSIWRTSGTAGAGDQRYGPASKMACAISTVPRSTPPVTRDGRTCSTTGGPGGG